MAQVIERNECRGFGRRRIGELANARIGRFEERAPRAENLHELTLDLKPHGPRGDVSEYGTEVNVESRASTRGQVDLLNIDHAIRQVGGQKIFPFDGRHVEY